MKGSSEGIRTGWPKYVTAALRIRISDIAWYPFVKQFYIGRTNDIEATKSRHRSDAVIALYETESVCNAIIVEDDWSNYYSFIQKMSMKIITQRRVWTTNPSSTSTSLSGACSSIWLLIDRVNQALRPPDLERTCDPEGALNAKPSSVMETYAHSRREQLEHAYL